MLKKIVLQAIKWKNTNIHFGRIAMNLSITQLEQISLISDIQTILKETNGSAKHIEFEIAESVFESSNDTIHENLFNLKKLGIAITVDGFGADIPIFHFIEPLGIEKFKIAKNYIQNVPGCLVGEAMVKSVLVLARELGVDVVGERVDNLEREEFLRTTQLTTGQLNHQPEPMRVGEATFYLRCNKKK